ncbi:MAG: hypothetical protein U0487_01770 [Patescibacteria group bacterium]
MRTTSKQGQRPIDALFARRRHHALTREETHELIAQYQSSTDPRQKRDIETLIVSAHFSVAVKLAKPYLRQYRGQPEEIASVAYLALRSTMERFDPSYATAFTTYLAQWARAYAARTVHNEEFGAMRIPVHTSNLRSSIARVIKRIQLKTGQQPPAEQVLTEAKAAELVWATREDALEQIRRTMDAPSNAALSLDTPFSEDGISLYHFTDDKSSLPVDDQAQLQSMQKLSLELFAFCYEFLRRHLGFVELDIILSRYVLNETLLSIGERLDYSRERIRQITDAILPNAFAKKQWFDPRLIGDAVNLVLVSHRSHPAMTEILPPIFLGFLSQNQSAEVSFVVLGKDGTTFDDAWERCKLTRKRAFANDLICCTSQLPYVGSIDVRQRVETGLMSGALPTQLKRAVDLKKALSATLTDKDHAGLMLFDHGRQVLHALYPHRVDEVNFAIEQAERDGYLLIFTNEIQGEALRFVERDDLKHWEAATHISERGMRPQALPAKTYIPQRVRLPHIPPPQKIPKEHARRDNDLAKRDALLAKRQELLERVIHLRRLIADHQAARDVLRHYR